MTDCLELRDHKTQRAVAEGAIVMYSTTWCSDCRRAKRVFASFAVPCTEINIEENADAAKYVLCVNEGMRSVPTIIFPDGSLLVEPDIAELEEKVRALTASR